MSNVNFLATKVFEDISNAVDNGYNLIVEEGSSRSSKTWSNFQVLFVQMYKTPNLRIKVFRDTKASCYSIVEDDFVKWASDPMLRKKQYEDGLITIEEMDAFLKEENLTRFFDRNKTNHVWTMIGSGSTLKFTGLDDEDEAMGMTQDIAWLNEPYGFSKEVFLQLKQRTSKFILFDWNPKSDHFINIFKKDEDCITLYSTFEDNPYCPLNMKKQIWSYQPMEQFSAVLDGRISEADAFKYDSVKNELGFTKKELAELQRCLTNEMNETKSLYHWMVYGRGLASESPNKIYSGWEGIKREKYDAIKRSLDTTPMYGLDFGFRNPSACVEVLYDGDSSFYIRSLIYKPILSMVSGLGDEMVKTGVPVGDVTYIFADSQDRDISNNVRMINELRLTHRLNVIPVNKPGYKERFDFINKMKIYYVMDEGDEIKNEYDKYQWEFINGVPTEKPIKKDDHCFVGDTYITTDSGERYISRINVGDKVLTRNGYKKVLLKHENGFKVIRHYTFLLGDGTIVSQNCTIDHAICTNKGFIPIEDIEKGDFIYKSNLFGIEKEDMLLKCKVVEIFKGDFFNKLVYDLTVEDYHEYFANGILVSNCMNAIEYGVWGSKEYFGINI